MATFPDAVTAAISAHAAWSTHLSVAIATGEAGVAVADAARDDRCPFGRWLMGDGALRAAPQYPEVLALHARFHLEAARVLALALDGRAGEASAALGPGGPYQASSAALTAALVAWRAAG